MTNRSNLKIGILSVPFVLALQSSVALAQVPEDYFWEKAVSLLSGEGFSNFTPHTGAETQVFTQGDSNGRATETVTFDSFPAPYVRVIAEAWRQSMAQGAIPRSAISAHLNYGFTVSGPANALVPVRFRGHYAINNDSAFTYTNAGVTFSTHGMDFSRPDTVGLFAQCDGSSDGYRCFMDPTVYSSVNSSIQSTMKTLGFETELWGAAISGTFEGVLMAPTDASGMALGAVGLSVFASAIGIRDNGRSGISWAFIDPELSIDADYLAQFPQAQLLLTPGVGNQMAPVPEPSTWAMLLAGLGLLAGVARRRR